MATAEIDLSATPIKAQPVQALGKPFAIRAGAYVIDLIVLNVAYAVVLLGIVIIVGAAMTLTGREVSAPQQGPTASALIASLIVDVLYFTIFEWLYGATLGKRIFRMRVVGEDGRRCSFGRALGRACLRDMELVLFAIPAFLTMKAPLNQRMGDRIAHTLVVGAKDPIIQQPRSGWWFLAAAGVWLGLAFGVAVLLVPAILQ